MEAALRKAVVINNINDYIRLMQRYEIYIAEFNRLGNALARRLLNDDYQHLGLNKLSLRLYCSHDKNQVIFENDCAVTFYLKEKNDLSMATLIDLYHNNQFSTLLANFRTPLIMNEEVKSVLPNYIYSETYSNIKDTIHELLKDRKGKVGRLLFEI